MDDVPVLLAEVVHGALQLFDLLLLSLHSLISILSEELLLGHFRFGSSSFGGHFAKIGSSTFQG